MYSKYIFVIASCVFAGANARPNDIAPEKLQPTVIPIVSQSEEFEPNGTYKFSYETGNGIKREETAYQKILPKGRGASSSEGGDSNESDEIHVQEGSFSYTAPDGTVITLRYIADENGFQPIGDHLPKAPKLQTALSNSAEKSGRALKVADTEESASVPVKAKTVEKQAEVVPSPEEIKTAPLPQESNISSSEGDKSPAKSEDNGSANVDVSSEIASTTVPVQPTTKSEQASTASVEQATSAPEQLVSAEVSESSSSTSAPEESSPSETVGQSAFNESINQSPSEEIQQQSTTAPEPASVEESSSTTIST
ncbi:flocculation protein FLO11-like [Melitaea cinxia]|uniref:flocculation protein FLO11-like n=1 Tax=Melitaea cinxia TaxID=113334 RepID=UPI001E270283|nr:flocculation protein FLO11-like [Melitaea cinxia]